MNIRKKSGLLLGAFAALILMAFSANMLLTTVPVRVLGPFYTTPVAWDSTSSLQVGCHVQYYLSATNDSPRIGQAVYVSAKNTVSHSATLANYNAIAGIVVGGTRTSMQASYVVGDTSTLVATTGQRVIVCDEGRAWVLVDTGPGVAPGLAVQPSTRAGMAGRLTTKAAPIDSLSRVFGRLVDTAIAGKAVLVQVRVR